MGAFLYRKMDERALVSGTCYRYGYGDNYERYFDEYADSLVEPCIVICSFYTKSSNVLCALYKGASAWTIATRKDVRVIKKW